MEHNTELKLKNDEKTHNENGGGWIILGSFFIHFITGGILYSFGIIYPQLLNEFKESKAYTSWILSLMTGLGALLGPIATFLVKKYGCRAIAIAGSLLCAISFFASSFATNVFTLIVTIGIGGGLSLALIFIPPIICVTTHFKKRRALATGMASATDIGSIFAPFMSFLIANYDWRKALVIFSGIMLTSTLFSALLRSVNSSIQEKDRLESKISPSNSRCKDEAINSFKQIKGVLNLDLFADPVFVLFCLSNFITCLGYYVPFFYIADKALTLNISKEKVSYLVSTIGLTNLLGRLTLGHISDKQFINRLWIYNISLILCGAASAMSFLCVDYATLMIFCGVFGFTSAGFPTLNSVILADLRGLAKIESAFGLVLMSRGMATFISAPIVGHLYDSMHSYTPGFLFIGAMISLGGAILFAVPALQKWIMRRQLQHKCDHIESNGAP